MTLKHKKSVKSPNKERSNMDTVNRFDEIEHQPLRTYNRVVMCYNLAQDSGEEATRSYLSSFSEDERKQMFVLTVYLQKMGQKATYEYVTKGLKFKYNVGEEGNQEVATVH